MRLGLRVQSWLGPERLALDVPVVSWQWSEKAGKLPSGLLTVDVPADWWPDTVRHPLRPMGQVLRGEVLVDGVAAPLPPCRVQSVEAQSGSVTVTADSLDGAVAEDPWPAPSSPVSGASLAQEAARLAEPLRTRLDGVPNVVLPEGLAWSGERADALVELAESRSAYWRLDADGTLVCVPLGNVADPDRRYSAAGVLSADRVVKRSKVTKGTATIPAQGEVPAVTATAREAAPAYQPGLYGTVGKVVQGKSGATRQQLEQMARDLLVESGVERSFTITPDPTLRAGMTVAVEVAYPNGTGETVTGRVVSHSIKSDGGHDVTVREAA